MWGICQLSKYISLSNLSVTWGIYRSVILCGPAASSLPLALFFFLLKGKSRCDFPAAAHLLKTAQIPLHNLRVGTSLLWDEYGRATRMEKEEDNLHPAPVAGFKMSIIRWSGRWYLSRSHFWALNSGFVVTTRTSSVLLIGVWSTMKRNKLWNEDMDFARRFWQFLLLKPDELNSGNYAVNLRVSYVSMSARILALILSIQIHSQITLKECCLASFVCFTFVFSLSDIIRMG